MAVALAEKGETLAGFWLINLQPTGSKDPFALRRAALGAIRTVIENGMRIHFLEVFGSALKQLTLARARSRNLRYRTPAGSENSWHLTSFYEKSSNRVEYRGDAEVLSFVSQNATVLIQTSGDDGADITEDIALPIDFVSIYASDLLTFLHDRLKVYLRDRGIRHDVIDAALAMPGSDDLTLLVNRATALQTFLATDDGENLIQGFKRAHNILRQAEEKDGVEYSFGPDPKLADTPEEKALFTALDTAEAAIAPAMEAENFAAAMSALAGLRTPIDAFFEAVQVNDDSPILRRNRLNLLHRISAACLAGADLTRIEASGSYRTGR